MSAIDDGSDAPDSNAGSGSDDVSAGVGGGILGNLPNTRPAVRSPRRSVKRNEGGGGDTSHKSGATGARTPPAPGRGGIGGLPEAAPEDAESGSELEALARGGLAAAGAAATVGLRIAGRAAAALRDVIEPR